MTRFGARRRSPRHWWSADYRKEGSLMRFGEVRGLSWRLPAGSKIISIADWYLLVVSTCSFWMKRIACWTWDSYRPCGEFFQYCPRNAKLSAFPQLWMGP